MMPVIDKSILRGIPLFQLFDDAELDTLTGHLDEEKYLAGQYVFKVGDEGGTMYIVSSGRVELFVEDKAGDRVSLSTVGAGEMFGELSLLDNKPRSATGKALENTTLIAIDREDLQIVVQRHPAAALDMMAALGRRIRESNLLVRERVVRNVNEEMPQKLSIGERVADFLTMLSGDIRFVYFSFLWFFSWITINVGLIPGIEPFDPFPFGLLTMVVSLEAIFLSLFVLMSQNRQAAREKVRNDIEYEINVKAEMEIRHLSKQLDEMQAIMAQHFGVLHDQQQELKKQFKTELT